MHGRVLGCIVTGKWTDKSRDSFADRFPLCVSNGIVLIPLIV